MKLKKKKKKIVELEFHIYIYIYIFKFDHLYLIFYKSSFTLKLDFEKIEFQNKDTDLNTFNTGIYC